MSRLNTSMIGAQATGRCSCLESSKPSNTLGASNKRNQSLSNRLYYVYCDGISGLLIALAVRYTRLLDSFMRLVRKSLQTPTLERCQFSDTVLLRTLNYKRDMPSAGAHRLG